MKMSLSQEIKQYGLDLGFCKVGITDAGEIPFFHEVMTNREDYYFPWLNNRTFPSDPKVEMPECKSIIVAAYDYANVNFPEELTALAGRAYLARCYVPRSNSIHGARLQLFEDFLKEKGMQACQIKYNLPLRQFARKAGVTSFGKNNFAYVDGVGSFVILYGFLVDRELEYDEPQPMSKCPPSCTRCIDACPTKAMLEPFFVDPMRCIGYNNWMRRGKSGTNFDPVIPEELRPMIGTRLHGCDVCQEVCPRNKKKLNADFPQDAFLELLKEHLNLKDMLLMDEDYYRTWVYPIMYNYIPDKRYLQRNAAIAIGNTKDPAYIPALREAMELPDEMIRLHAQWALAQISSALNEAPSKGSPSDEGSKAGSADVSENGSEWFGH